jgi:hypothetical protein
MTYLFAAAKTGKSGGQRREQHAIHKFRIGSSHAQQTKVRGRGGKLGTDKTMKRLKNKNVVVIAPSVV